MNSQANTPRLKKLGESLYKNLLNFISSRVFLWLSFGWFTIQSAYIAISTKFGMPPDETYHYGLIQLFARNGWLPFIHNQAGYYVLGEVRRSPSFLYEYLLSLPYHLFEHSSHAVTLLRFINIGLGLFSLYLMVKLANKLQFSKLIRNLSIFMLTNVLMFVFLSASINYDNLLVPLGLLLFTTLLPAVKKLTAPLLAALVIILICGCLTVVNFLPLAFASFLIILFSRRKQLPSLPGMIRTQFAASPVFAALTTIAIVLLSALFLQRYAVNIVHYHALSPACNRVNTLKQCEQEPIFVRTQILTGGKPPHITTSTFSYTTQWTTLMLQRTFGILAQKGSVAPTFLISAWYQILLILFPIAIIRKFKIRHSDIAILLGISLFYILALMHTNYTSYLQNGMIGLAVQGRYLFPVLPIVFLVSNRYTFELFGKAKYLTTAYILITLLAFITAGLPSYMIGTGPFWYTSKTQHVNTKLHAKASRVYHSVGG